MSSSEAHAGAHPHWNTASASTQVGSDMGRKIGELVATTQLRGAMALAAPPR